MTEWVCRWNPFWIPSGDTFQKAYLEEWERVNDEQSHAPCEGKPHRISRTTESDRLQTAREDEWNTTRELPCDAPSLPKSLWQAFGESNAPSWEHIGTQESAVFWEPLGAPLLQKNRVRTFIHPRQFGICPKRLSLPYPDEEILSGYEEDVSSTRDCFFGMGENGPEITLWRHTVDAEGANPAFREALARKHSPAKNVI